MTRADRERMVGCIRYFAENTGQCTGRKLFKLLYLADVLHFQQTGQPITGLEYIARRSTPLPHALKYELENPREDLSAAVEISQFREGSADRHLFAPSGAAFNFGALTRRELEILGFVAAKFALALDDQIDVDAYDHHAWRNTVVGRPIDLLDTLDPADAHYADLIDLARQHRGRMRSVQAFG
jgi:hypothetical protein